MSADTLLREAQGLLRELPGLLSDRIELLSLELERAGRALAKVAIVVVAVAILGVTAWLALWGVVIGLLIAAGAPWWVALAVVLVVNLVVAAVAVMYARKQLPLLALPATRRHLTVSPAIKPPLPVSEPPVHERPHVQTPVQPAQRAAAAS